MNLGPCCGVVDLPSFLLKLGSLGCCCGSLPRALRSVLFLPRLFFCSRLGFFSRLPLLSFSSLSRFFFLFPPAPAPTSPPSSLHPTCPCVRLSPHRALCSSSRLSLLPHQDRVSLELLSAPRGELLLLLLFLPRGGDRRAGVAVVAVLLEVEGSVLSAASTSSRKTKENKESSNDDDCVQTISSVVELVEPLSIEREGERAEVRPDSWKLPHHGQRSCDVVALTMTRRESTS